MGAGAGFALKFLQWFIRGIQFCCAAVVLALTSYFLATLHNHNMTIDVWLRAVEGISGIAVLYTILGLLLLCCLAGFTLTSFIAIVLDVCFVGAFIYVAQAYRGGASSCTGVVNTPFGQGNANDRVTSNNDGFTSLPTYRSACKMETACLAVSIVAIFFFIFSAITEVALGRHRKKEKRFGPSPANNYTSGYGSRKRGLFGWRRTRTDTTTTDPNALPEHTHPDQVRQSYGTEATRVDDAGAGAGATYPKYGEAGYNEHGYNGATTQPASYRYTDGVYNAA